MEVRLGMAKIIRRMEDTWNQLRSKPLIAFALAVSQRFGRDNGALVAAGLAFFAVLSFIPLLLTGIAVVGYYFAFLHHVTGRSSDAVEVVRSLITSQILPGAPGHEVRELMNSANIPAKIAGIMKSRGINAIVGMATLIWTSLQIYLQAAVGLNATWSVTETRSWLKLRLVALGLIVTTGLFLVLSIALTAYGTRLSHLDIGGFIPAWRGAIDVLTEIGALLGAAVMYAITFKYLPSCAVSWKAAGVGALVSACCWEVAKRGLAVYLLHPNTSMYGNLANLILFILWLYYSMTIFVLGANVAAVYAETVEKRTRAKMKDRARHAYDPAAHPA